MARNTKLGNVVAGDVDGLTFIGRLVTYSMPDDYVSGPKLVRTWAAHGLDVNDLPTKRHGFHVFQAACRSVESRRANGLGVEVHVDEADHTATECVYQITRMERVKGKGGATIEHHAGMTLTYDKTLDTISTSAMEDYDAVRGLEDKVRQHFTKNAAKIPGQKIRNSVRATILKLGGQNLRRKAGGLYFVPHEFVIAGGNGRTAKRETLPFLDGLAGVFDELYGERGDFYMIPLVNNEGAKKMVAKHFAINISDRSREAMERAIQRVRQGKGSRGVRADLLASLWNERRAIAGAIETFESLVDIERKEIDKNLGDLDKALGDLQDLADS